MSIAPIPKISSISSNVLTQLIQESINIKTVRHLPGSKGFSVIKET